MDVKDSKGNRARKAHEIREKKFKKKSDLLERERSLDTTNIEYVQELFWEHHMLRQPIQSGVAPLDPIRMKTHSEMVGKPIGTWEYRLLMDMDLIYRSCVMQKLS